jgi:integrase
MARKTIRREQAGVWYELRPNASGVYYIHWSENRRSKRQSTGTKEVGAASAFLDEWLRLATAKGAPEALTCRDLWEAKYGGPREQERVRYAWANMEPVFGDLRPAEATQERLDDYAASRAAGRIGKKAASPSTIRLEMSLLRASWNHAVTRRKIATTDLPVLDPLPDPSPPRDRWLKDAEVKRLFEAAKGRDRIEMFLWLALETGARRTAILELRWEQVDWETGVIHYLPAGQAQSKKRRASVPISAALRPVLLRAYEERTTPYVLGRPTPIRDALNAVAAAAGVKGVTPHVLRHTAATRMARAGVPLWLIAKVLGNTVEQVENVYAKHSPEMLVSAVEAISGRRAA